MFRIFVKDTFTQATLILCAQLLSHIWLFVTPGTDCSPQGSSIHGISQARILEWVATSFSRGSSQPRDQMVSLALAGEFFTTEPPGKPHLKKKNSICLKVIFSWQVLSWLGVQRLEGRFGEYDWWKMRKEMHYLAILRKQGWKQQSGKREDRTVIRAYLAHCLSALTRILDRNVFAIKTQSGTSLVVQWIRICLSMQGTQVWSLVWEDSTCLWATEPSVPQLLSPSTLEPCPATKSSPCLPQLEEKTWAKAKKTQCIPKINK